MLFLYLNGDDQGCQYEDPKYLIILQMFKTGLIVICVTVLGTDARPVYVRSHWRVQNGKRVHVKAHWRKRKLATA